LPRVHIIHVGSVTNKGTLALLEAQLSELDRMCQSDPLEMSVSTCDVDALKASLPKVRSLSLLVDIPHEKADIDARTFKIDRSSFRYLLRLLIYSVLIPPEIALSVFSSFLFSLGLSFYRANVITAIASSDLIISTADESFKEGSSNLPFNTYWKLISWAFLISRTTEILIAKHVFKKPIIVFPNSVGPLRTFLGRFLTKIALNNVDLLFLREAFSLEWTHRLKLKIPIIVTSDIVFLSHVNTLDFTQSDETQEPIIVVCPGIYAATISRKKQLDYVSAHSQALDTFIENHHAKVVFLPHETTGKSGDDYTFCRLIFNRMKNADRAMIMKTKALKEFTVEISGADLMLSSRMHPAVIAFSYRIPTIVVCYDFKQLGLVEQLDMSKYAIDINQISYERLLSMMEMAWNNKSKIQEQLSQKVPILQNDIRNKIESSSKKFFRIMKEETSEPTM
jgi:polysaccharide pyruvyl transferase WcaK-like protein